MDETISLQPDTFRLLRQRAEETQSTPDRVAEDIIRLQLGNTIHIEQRSTAFGPQAYLRGTRVGVRHIAAFLKSGRSAEEISREDLPHLPAAAVYEALAYYYDHRVEIDAELDANKSEVVRAQLSGMLNPDQFARLTGQSL